MTARGLRLRIYTNGTDCSNGGVSSRTDSVTLIGQVDRTRDPRNTTITPLAGDSRVFEPTDDAPAAALSVRSVNGKRLLCVVPVELIDRWTMFGGCYVAGDSRFADLSGFYGAMPLHDRHES